LFGVAVIALLGVGGYGGFRYRKLVVGKARIEGELRALQGRNGIAQ
jgi:hypothetical protein